MKVKFGLPRWLGIPISIAILGVTIAIGMALEKFSPSSVIGAIIVVILASSVGALVARLTSSQQILVSEGKLEEKLKGLQEQANRFQDGCQKLSDLPEKCQECTKLLGDAISSAKEIARIALERFGRSIVTYHELVEIEGSVKEGGEIWVLTQALELEGSELKEVIRNNFKKGIKYVYLIPKEEKVLQKQMVDLAREWKEVCGLSVENAKRQIRCFLVPKHFAYMTVIVYEPYGRLPTVLVKFPTSQIYEKEKYPFIYRVDAQPQEAWKAFVNSIQELIHDQPTCPQAKVLPIDFS